MSILLARDTAVIVQGFTGRTASFHAGRMAGYGTAVTGGVAPGKGGSTHLDLPVFNTVRGAVQETGATASIVFVPPPFAADAIMEAADAGIGLCVCVTHGIPAQDMMNAMRYLARTPEGERMILIGPSATGIITPGQASLGVMPGEIFRPGRVGLVSRSGTLGFEAAEQMTARGIGVSSAVGIGSDPICGVSFGDVLRFFNDDADTDAVVMIGETDSAAELNAARWARQYMTKPLVVYITERQSRHGAATGHADAIIRAFAGPEPEQVGIIRDLGHKIVPHPAAFGETIENVISNLRSVA